MTLNVLSAPSAEQLLPELGRFLAGQRPDVLAKDVVVVPGRGMADWLQEHLSVHMGESGIVANIDFWLPGEFTRKVAAKTAASSSVWNADQLKWEILELLAKNSQSDLIVPGFDSASRRLQFASRVADLIDGYANQRPDMLVAWQQGQEIDGRYDLEPQHRWQVRLWQQLRSILGECWSESLMRPSVDDPALCLGPEGSRLALFGLDFLSRSTATVLARLAEVRDVGVYHLSPVEGLVEEFKSHPLAVGKLRRELNLAETRRHALLAAWSRSALESAVLLGPIADTVTTVPGRRTPTVLGSLQASLMADEPTTGTSAPQSDQCDGSVQIHRCHGTSRQVEVLRDAILHVLASDSSLRPRDVIILCPDLERFAPVVESIMSAPLDQSSHRLPVSIVDRANATATPVGAALDALLRLVSGRCSVSEVLEVLSLDAVRRRLNLDDAELAQIDQWAEHLNIRWGIDSGHRALWGYPMDVDEGTWLWAIERLSAGVVLQSTEIAEDLPGLAVFDDVSARDAATVGKLFNFFRRLRAVNQQTSLEHSLASWADIIEFLLEHFIAVGPSERTHLLDVHEFVRYMREASSRAPSAAFGVLDMRDLLNGQLPSLRRAGLRWADVVRVGTPGLFRGIPSRVIAFLGFDDDALRPGGRSADDILAHEPRVGERDHRADERLGLLTMLHAAQDCIIITCDGHDVNDNAPIPMPVPLEELKDATVEAIARLPEGSRGHRPLVIDHSRQSADPVNVGLFSASELKNASDFVDGPWTFDPSVPQLVELTGRAARESLEQESLSNCALPPLHEDEIPRELELSALVSALRRPTELFLRDRLGVVPPGDDAAIDSEVALWPSPLEFASLGRELLEVLIGVTPPPDWRRRRGLIGGLPLKAAANAMWDEVEHAVDGVMMSAGPALDIPESAHDVRLTVPDKDVERLGGSSLIVNGLIRTRDSVRLSLNFAKWHRRLRVDPWIEIAALTMHDPTVRWTARVVARPLKDSDGAAGLVEEFQLAGTTSEERVESALRVLCFANEIRHRALRSAIPLFERSSWFLDPSLKAARSTIESELSYDLDRAATRFIFGSRSVSAFDEEPLVAGVDDGVPANGSRLRSYATWLNLTWNETVEVVTSAEPAKTRGVGRRLSKNSTTDKGAGS